MGRIIYKYKIGSEVFVIGVRSQDYDFAADFCDSAGINPCSPVWKLAEGKWIKLDDGRGKNHE